MSTPRVTVIVPVYNDERHLPEALESIAAQSYPGWKTVVVDDGSTDRSGEIADRYAARDGRFMVMHLQQNVGVPAGRNLAIASSPGGDLISLLDSDDYWREDYLEHMLRCYDDATAVGGRVGVVACDALIHGPEGLTNERWSERFWWKDAVEYDSMIERNYVLARVVFSRRAYEEVGEFSPHCEIRDRVRGLYAASDDYDMWLRMLEAGYEIVHTREPVARYRILPGGRSWSPGIMARATIAAYERALERDTATPRQRRAIRAAVRHHRALVARAKVLGAVAERRWTAAAGLGLKAAPLGLVALLQSPSRWLEWLRLPLLRRERPVRTPEVLDAR